MKTETKLTYLTSNAKVVRVVNPANLKRGQIVEFDFTKNYLITDVKDMGWGVEYTLRYKKTNDTLGKTKKAVAYYK